MRLAVLGCGSIGRRHLRNLRELGEGDLLACDPDPAAREAVAREFGVPVLAAQEEVWARGPEAVLVTSPSALHVPQALEAVRRGCHLFVEKPLSHTLEGTAELAAEAEARGVVTMVACNLRFHPGPATVKRLLEEEAVGRVLSARIHSGSYLPRWRPWQDYRRSYSASPVSGGAILDMIHEIDLTLWYLGPGRLAAAEVLDAACIGLETDGLAELLLRHDSGALSSVHLNFVQRDYRRSCQVLGSEGSVYWDFEAAAVRVYGPDGALTGTHAQPPAWEMNRMYLDELAHFLRAARSGVPSVNPLAGGIAALRLALQARRSFREAAA